jgi:hypothetical protein
MTSRRRAFHATSRAGGLPAVLLFLVAVATPGAASALELLGQSTGTPQLKSDILKSLLPMAAAASQCQAIDTVTASVLVPPRNVETNADGVILKGDDIVERWVTEGCGKRMGFKVTLSFDGVGGTYFRITAEG